MLSGRADGQPPLTRDMSLQEWSDTLEAAYLKLVNELNHHEHTYINSYASTNPAEFFAVSTETFFEKPRQLKKNHPELFNELLAFYKVNPLEWI